jgi:hypothetical protein
MRTFAEFRTTGRTPPYEKEYYRKDGTRLWGLFAAKLLNDGLGFELLQGMNRGIADADGQLAVHYAAHSSFSSLWQLHWYLYDQRNS